MLELFSGSGSEDALVAIAFTSTFDPDGVFTCTVIFTVASAPTTIVPGIFPTELNADILNGTPRGRELIMRTPMARFGRHDEVVGTAVFLASDCATFITGQAITVDGGFLASGVNS